MHYLLLLHFTEYRIDRQIFDCKNISWLPGPMKINYAKCTMFSTMKIAIYTHIVT